MVAAVQAMGAWLSVENSAMLGQADGRRSIVVLVIGRGDTLTDEEATQVVLTTMEELNAEGSEQAN